MATQGLSPSKSKAAEKTDAVFCLIDHVVIPRFLSRMKLSTVCVAVLCFVGYSLVPLLLAAAEGVLITPAFATSQLMTFGLEAAGRWLSKQTSAYTYSTSDVTQLLMAVTV